MIQNFGRHKVTKISLVTKISTDFCFCRLFLLPTIFYADFFLPIRYVAQYGIHVGYAVYLRREQVFGAGVLAPH